MASRSSTSRAPLRPVGEVIGSAALTGLCAGALTGVVDASVAWGQATQFVPGVLAHVRFIVFAAVVHALAGLVLGALAVLPVLFITRVTRLGDALRFGLAEHEARRARDPLTALTGASLALAAVPSFALCLLVAYRLAWLNLAERKAMDLVIALAIAAGVAAIGAAIPLVFGLGRLIEWLLVLALRRAPGVVKRAASHIVAPGAVLVACLAGALAIVAHREWETAKLLPLRTPIVALLAIFVAAPVVMRPARAAAALFAVMLPWLRRTLYLVVAALLLVLALALGGGNGSATKASAAYTGLGGPITRALRNVFDWDRDGYARYLGGGDCDDGDATIHPGAAEIPDDGIDQNCSGGDTTTKPATLADRAFVPVPPAVPKDFNIILVTIDTLRADHLGTYGYARPTSPALDKLAKDGTVFVHGYAHAPSTRYSMPAILTGRYPLDVFYDHAISGWPGLLPAATTIAELLQPLGFKTGAITNYEYFQPYRRFNQGFDEYDNENMKLHAAVPGKGPEETRGSSSKEQTDKSIAFVDKHAADRFFLWVHYYDPHYSYELHPEVKSFGNSDMDRYDNEIEFTDMHIGRLVDALRAKGLYDKTVIVVTGDHGEGFGEHNVTMHGYHLYTPQTIVPMIVRVPGLPPRRSETPASHIDIMPTLVDLAGGAPTADMEGRSLVDVLAGAPDRDRTIYQELSYENNHEMRAAASQKCQVIYNITPDTSWEVYRLDDDLLETHDLSDNPDECAATRTALQQFYDQEQIPAGATEALMTAAPAAQPLAIDLGDAVRLVDFHAPATAHPGASIDVAWTFAARGTPDNAGWKMFVHLDPVTKGGTFILGDHAPPRPFAWWRAGQFIHYTSKIAIPGNARGTYRILAGMFAGARRAHVTGPPGTKIVEDAVELGTIEIAP